MKSIVYNEDCIQGMKRYEDNYFQLAVVDPPYGLGIDGQKLNNTNKNPKHNRKAHEFKDWDDAIPDEEYFKELMRVSQHQIVWGGNYFTEFLQPTKAWIFWYKGQNDLTMSDGEMAWTSLKQVTRQVNINRFKIKIEGSIHPTQKPVKLYDFCFKYAKVTEGMKILDTHLGSGSSRISADKNKLDFVGFETDKQYFDAQEKRFNFHIQQQTLF